MNPDKLLDAIGMLDDRYFEPERKPHMIPWRRRLIALVAAVLMLIASVGTAMAVSPEFRALAFRFLRIEQEQVIPDSTVNTELSVEDMFAEPSIRIGDVLQGKYVHTPVATNARSGIYKVCTDEVEMRQGSHYDAYYEENGEFIKLEEHTFNQDYVIYGNEIHVEFDWVEHNGSVSMTWVDPEVPFRKENESGDASAALFTFNIRWEEDGEYKGTSYPMLLNLYTGELTDILAGTDANRMSRIDKCAISPDHTKLLLGQDTKEDYLLYYADLSQKQIYSVDELSGQHATACSLIGNTLACWNLTDGYYTAWKIDLNTLERTELFDSKFNAVETPETDAGIVFMAGFDGMNRWGNMYIGSCFALEVDEAQNVCVIDLATGSKTQIEGYTWTPETQRVVSPDGAKLLLTGGHNGKSFGYVGVLDFENMTFAEFYRDNSRKEHTAYWFDNNTIVICAEVNYNSLCKDYYLYSLVNSGQPLEGEAQ